MRFRSPDHIAWCVTAGQVVFLDIRRDRYAQLAPGFVRVFRQAVAAALPEDGPTLDTVAELVRQGLLVEAADDRAPGGAPVLPRPRSSLLEGKAGPAGSGWLATGLSTLTQVLKIRTRMRRLTFEGLLSGLPPADPVECADPAKTARAMAVARGFSRWRAAVPIQPVCLLDSLALIDRLRRDGLPGRLVFGVALQPFTAHCWVQLGEVVLNDRLDRALAHTPILVA